MGKKRLAQLLDQLKENQQQELENAAGIFTVAQVAVNNLQRNLNIESEAPALQPSAPVMLSKEELLQRHGSFNGCRKAAKEYGIKFSKTPSWEALGAAFAYAEALRSVLNEYVKAYPNDMLRGVTIEMTLN